MGKIIGAVLVILGIGAVANQIVNHAPTQVPVQQTTTTQSVATSEPTKKDLVLRDVKYGNDKRNTMNILIPKGSNDKTPFILFMHGGAWITGDKNDLKMFQLVLGQSGIASASINYRYASDTIHYSQLMEDVHRAVRYITEHDGNWGISTEKIAIGGMSAGAHMALLYTYHYDTENRINSVISLAGPTDLTQVDFLNSVALVKLIDGANKMTGATYEFGKPVPSQFKDVSPIQYVKDVPTLIIHGTGDVVVPYTQAELLSDKLKQKSYTHDLMTIPNANHDLGLGNKVIAKQIVDRIVVWVGKYNK